MHTPTLEGVVAAVAGVEKEREMGVLMLEELEHSLIHMLSLPWSMAFLRGQHLVHFSPSQ